MTIFVLKKKSKRSGLRGEGPMRVIRFPCCVLSYFSLVFVMEHSRRWQLHIGGSKMFELLFHAGMSVLDQFFLQNIHVL